MDFVAANRHQMSFFACYGAYGYVAFITTKLCNQAVRKLYRHITLSATLRIRLLPWVSGVTSRIRI
jgi:hypothetical protein